MNEHKAIAGADAATPALRDADRQRELETQGFTVVRLMSAEEAQAAREKVEQALEAIGAVDVASPSAQTVMSYIESDLAFRTTADKLAREILAGRLEQVADGYRIVSGSIFFKAPSAGEVAVHRDWTQTVDRREVTFSLWCALDDVDSANGALQMVPGSHRLEPAIATLNVTPFFAAYSDLVKQKSVPVDLAAGEAVLFDSRTIHWSPANRSDRPRRALQVVAVPKPSRHVFYALDRASGGARFELIDVTDVGVVECTPADLLAGARAGESLGHVDNDNRPVSRGEFKRLLERAVDAAADGTAPRHTARVPVLSVSNLAKKFCPTFHRALAYGVADIGRELIGRPAPDRLRTGEFWALDDLTFDLHAGEALAVVGHNGAGKTTLLKILSGLIKPDRGSVRLRGRSAAILELGSEFDARLSGRENIEVGAAIHGVPSGEVRRLIDAVTDFAELGTFVDAPVQTYSSGMRARLAYSLSAHLKPDLLFIDEVLAVGDFAFQRKCVTHMKSYLRDGGSLLLVSHSVAQSQAVCDRGILLEKGRLIAEGDVVEVLNGMLQRRSGQVPTDQVPRRSDGTIEIVDVTARAADDRGIATGAPVELRLHYEAKESREVIWSFSIWAAAEWACVTGAIDWQPRKVEPGRGEFVCLVPDLPLIGGRYVLHAAVIDAASRQPIARFGDVHLGHMLDVTSPPNQMSNMEMLRNQLVKIDVTWR
ncbi:MAG TPA: phytanoyl-CoA dioxygenase family protein [Allosphingosinicella sp.]|nr:phytanoyl-CoA dioxygenase family protein [Allosphingosinicella sp.]